jgi:hypothetical protein
VNPRRALTLGLLALATAILGGAPAQAIAGPLYDIHAYWGETVLPPGGEGEFTIQARNIGDAVGSEALTITDELPAGVTATVIHFDGGPGGKDIAATHCTGTGTAVATCTLQAAEVPSATPAPGALNDGLEAYPTGYLPVMFVEVEVSPSAEGTGTNKATLSGGGGPSTVSDVDEVPFGTTPAGFGLTPDADGFEADFFDAAYPFGNPARHAGDHPFELRTNFDFTRRVGDPILGHNHPVNKPVAPARTVEVTLPRGVIGNPEATPKCDPLRFAERGAVGDATGCPPSTQVGYINITTNEVIGQLSRVAIYNLKPPKGTPVDLAFNAAGFVQAHIYAELDPSQNYAVKSVSPNIANLVDALGGEVTIWGVPGDPAHDKFRAYPKETEGKVLGAPFGGTIRPLLTNPSDCGFDNGGSRIRAESYAEPGVFTPVREYPNADNVSSCNDPRFRFEPEIAMQPSDQHAGAPTGLDVHLEVPLRSDEVTEAKKLYAQNGNVKGISTPPIKRAVVTFPEGMTLSPSAAQGLGNCTSAEIGLGTNDPVTCPDNSQYGKLILHTPILPINEQPEGFIYIAKQNDNPFHNFLSIYLVIEEPERGILVKIPGRLDLDPQTGQITSTFDDLPQFPVSDMEMSFKGGVRAGLVEPSTCGTKTIKAEFFSWQDPQMPHVVENHYDITQKPDGSPCVNSLGERPFKPQLEAGTTNNSAGSYAPFVFKLTRTDDDQEFSQIGATLPMGLAAKFAGVSICTDAGIAKAHSRETLPGGGAIEQADPSCPASSQIGTTNVGTGVGVPLSYVPGKVYLGGPYQGAPMSMAVISPAVIGPYDLGVITVRTALNVNPETAQGEALSDPFPQIFQGIPVRVRDIRLNLDKPNFTLNPTSCAVKQIDAHITGTGGIVNSTADDTGVDLSNRFQAADCASLGFKPNLALRLFGGAKRGAHPKFVATLRAREGDANIAGASVALPHSEFLDQAHIRTVCTRVQFAQKSCPAGSVYGHAVARTPLFDTPLGGKVYLRSSSHQLPDLVAVLKGPDTQPVEVDLDGRIDSIHGGIRNTFELVPDAPVSEFTLTMKGGTKGLLINSTDLCKGAHRATALFKAQNGKSITLRPALKSACGAGRRR